jgi:F-type H+-transporting ATPase subunit b
MPQLDFSTFAPQLVWLAIAFVGMYFLMAKVALPGIATVLEERRDRVANDLDQAEQLKRDTDAAIAAYEAALAEARARAHEIVGATREKLTAEIDAERDKVETAIAEKTAEADAAIRAATEQALGEIGNVATDTAEAIVKQLVGGRWTKAKISGAVDAAMKG